MRLILNEYYHGNSIVSRGVDADSPLVGKEAILKYKPLGGAANAVNGAGRNAIVGGNSGHGQIYGNSQINLFENESPKNAMDVFNIINKKTSSKHEFNQDMTRKISTIFEKYGHKNFEPINKVPSFCSKVLGHIVLPPKYSNSVGSIISPIEPSSINDISAFSSGIGGSGGTIISPLPLNDIFHKV